MPLLTFRPLFVSLLSYHRIQANFFKSPSSFPIGNSTTPTLLRSRQIRLYVATTRRNYTICHSIQGYHSLWIAGLE